MCSKLLIAQVVFLLESGQTHGHVSATVGVSINWHRFFTAIPVAKPTVSLKDHNLHGCSGAVLVHPHYMISYLISSLSPIHTITAMLIIFFSFQPPDWLFDEHLTFLDQISSLSRSCYYHIRQLGCIRPCLRYCYKWSVCLCACQRVLVMTSGRSRGLGLLAAWQLKF